MVQYLHRTNLEMGLRKFERKNSTEVKIQPGLYSFSDLVQMLTGQVEGFTITVNRTNGLINMIIPAGYQVWLPEAIRYLLGLEDEDWLSAGEYEGDSPVEFSPKRLLVYLKQLSTSKNFESLRTLSIWSLLNC